MAPFRFISIDAIPNVENWDQAEEVPTGSREKMTLIAPETGQHYIFKYPKPRREHQLWSELLASYIAGDLLDWDVQHTSIAEYNGRLGNLLCYVYEPGNKETSQEIFIEGWRLCIQADPIFDQGKGTRHTLPLLMRVCDEMTGSKYNMTREHFFDFWAKAFALDCLISNTDRHAENWAIITTQNETRMAPLYDNGSSLGCGIDQIGLNRVFDVTGNVNTAHLAKLKKNGRHHVRLDEPDKHGAHFEEICLAFLQLYPEGVKWFQAAYAVDIDAVCKLMTVIGNTVNVIEPYSLSVTRQKHICAMLQIGRERIKNIIC